MESNSVKIEENLDDIDYEKLQEILEEEEKNRLIRKEKESRKEKERKKEDNNRDKDRKRDKDHHYRGKDHSKRRSRSRSKTDRRSTKHRSSRSRSRDRYSKELKYQREKEERKREKLLVEKTIEEAQRQAIEAQRDDCTILVYRLNLTAKEKDLFRFFAQANIGRIIDIKVIRDPRTGKSKGAAYVEFENQESIVLAVALSGQQICGQSIVIQHSQAEKNRQAAAAKYKKDMIKEQQRINSKKPRELPDNTDPPMKIYVGGLTEHLADISDNDVRDIFYHFGEIDIIDMPKDPNTQKSRGYCFIQFRKASQAQAAMTAMNGFMYKGKILKVGAATDGTRNGNEMLLPTGDMDDESHNNYLHNLQSKQTLMQKLSRDSLPTSIGYSALPSSATPNPLAFPSQSNQTNIPQVSHSNCILLSNLFDPKQVNLRDEPNFYQDTKIDVFEECSSFGKVEDVWVDNKNPLGFVWIKFANNNLQAARAAVEKLNGRWFAKRPIYAQFVSQQTLEENIK